MIIYKDEGYRIWDSHSHFSNLVSKFTRILLKVLTTNEMDDIIFTNWNRIKNTTKGRKERNILRYKLLLDLNHIDKAVHLPVFKLDRKLSYRMNELYPDRFFGFGYINPRSKSLDEDLQELVTNNVYGIKMHPEMMKFTFKEYHNELLEVFQFCGENKIIILSHTGSHSFLLNIKPILKECEETVFIIGHSGLCPQISEAVLIAKEFPNSYLETSGNPYTYKFMEAIKDPDIGVERILFGTDIPTLNPRVEIQKVLALPISVEEKRMIFSYNLENLMKSFLKAKYKAN